MSQKLVQKLDLVGTMSYYNPEMVARYAKKHGVTIEAAQHLFEETKKFLVLAATMKDPISPSEELDEMWHHFVLHTKDYAEFCSKHFGKFIHHTPTETSFIGNRGEMMEQAIQLFGGVDVSIWPKAVAGAPCDGGGEGSCTGTN